MTQRPRWSASGQARSRVFAPTGPRGLAGQRHQPAPALAVGPRPGLPASRWPVVRRMPGRPPGTAVAYRAVVTPRSGGRADQRAQLHQGHRPGRGRGVVVGELLDRERLLGGGHGIRRELDAGHPAGQDPADVRVEDGLPASECERQHGRGRVVADAGEPTQRVVVVGDLAAVVLGDRGRGGVEPDRTAGVAESSPRPDGLTGRVGSEVRGVGPACEPRVVHRKHAGDGRLLEHELRDQHSPWRRGRPPPRQVTRVRVVPAQERRVDVGHPADRRTREQARSALAAGVATTKAGSG